MKIDVAVPSYKKPESLLYTLMTLKKVAGDLIDAVYIMTIVQMTARSKFTMTAGCANTSARGN